MKIKMYDFIKVKNGYQVVWYWGGSFIKTGYKPYNNYVKNGFFKNRKDAEDFANNLQLEEV